MRFPVAEGESPRNLISVQSRFMAIVKSAVWSKSNDQAPDGYSQQQTLLIFGLGFDFFFSTDFVGCFPITYQNWLLQSGPEVAQTSQHVNMIGQVCNGSISV